MPRIETNIVDCYPFRRTQRGIEFLMLQRAEAAYLGGTWHAVHGHVDAGETAVAAAVRELREEAGLTPLKLWQLEFVNTFFVAKLDAILMCPGFAAELDAAAAVVLSAEHQAFRWVAAEKAVQVFLWPGQRQAVAEVVSDILEGSAARQHLQIDW